MECYFAREYGVFGARECKRGIRGGGLFANFSALFREIMAGLGMGDKIDMFAGDRRISLRVHDRE